MPMQGPGARICDQCVNLCMSVLEEELGGQNGCPAVELPDQLPVPREIREIMDQLTFKKVLPGVDDLVNDAILLGLLGRHEVVTLAVGVFLGEEVNATTASLVVAQLLYLEAQDPDKDIQWR